jgi:hypothetical protein
VEEVEVEERLDFLLEEEQIDLGLGTPSEEEEVLVREGLIPEVEVRVLIGPDLTEVQMSEGVDLPPGLSTRTERDVSDAGTLDTSRMNVRKRKKTSHKVQTTGTLPPCSI